jgi:hypothetical protein
MYRDGTPMLIQGRVIQGRDREGHSAELLIKNFNKYSN